MRYLVTAERGIRILRGRAGTGKSHVLGTVGELVTKRGQHVIGLAPTHKAVSGLGIRGYQDRDTVKGFLFKLYNGKVTLKKRSLLVVDEAAMIGTSDYLELFKVAKKYSCNLVLAGDERQLLSIDRGGVFAVLAEKFCSCVLSDTKRQSKTWSQEMAKKFADYDVVGGLIYYMGIMD
ncbi:conjugal transfer protein TraA [Orientia tsutsugamushi]|nr:conjugal transfer protein TraA [Orientia tsutsugamushi]